VSPAGSSNNIERKNEQRTEDPWYESWKQGLPMDVEQAMRATGPKWCPEEQVSHKLQNVQRCFLRPLASETIHSSSNSTTSKETSSIDSMVSSLAVDDIEQCVAKVCPERIYSVAVHPSQNNLIVAAGDKQGHVGIWKVDDDSSSSLQQQSSSSSGRMDTNHNDDGVYLFKPHRGAVSCLAWTGGQQLISTSYDGTIRKLDIEKQQWIQEFNIRSTASDGDDDSNFWLQYACIDPNRGGYHYHWASTSTGTILGVDSRCDPSSHQHITVEVQASEKKINTIRYGIDGKIS
jgi:WD40 repeat protein